jgi:hypothetical protein
MTLVFEKNANIFAEICQKSQKIVIISSTSGHTANHPGGRVTLQYDAGRRAAQRQADGHDSGAPLRLGLDPTAPFAVAVLATHLGAAAGSGLQGHGLRGRGHRRSRLRPAFERPEELARRIVGRGSGRARLLGGGPRRRRAPLLLLRHLVDGRDRGRLLRPRPRRNWFGNVRRLELIR